MSLDLQQLEAAVDDCWLGDRFGFSRQLKRLRQRQAAGEPVDKALAQLAAKIQVSQQRVAQRRETLPAVTYPPELPVSQRVDDIRRAIAEHQVVVVAGETGSGKTTQIPKICLEMGRGVSGMIGHTQPRRLAARAVASRLAEELGTELGQGIGFQIRFQDNTAEHSHIKLMTDGILLAAIQRDRYLNQYDTLIIDEAHERSLNIDFLLGYLRQLLPKRPDLKLIITSATIDVERFSRHFRDAPVVEVSGRSYPVEIRYRPQEEISDDNEQAQAVEMALRELRAEGKQREGDVLVFLSGEREIREVAKHLRHCDFIGMEVLPLYARLSAAEQQRIFDLRGRRGWRVVLATNVAETSLTVPGIHFVIDAGTARISRYSYRSKVQRLPVEPVSQASANQRSGRCGRLAPGVAIRLFSEQDFEGRPAFTEPEIQRTNLAAVILQMLQLRLGDIEHFPFIDAPDRRLVNDGYKLLAELGAVEGKQLTELGRRMAQFPVDPRIARMLIAAAELGSLEEVLIIASALSIQDPRERPADKQQASDEKHRRFWHPESDFLGYVNLWNYFEEQRQALSQNQLRKMCQREFLSWLRMREWREVHYQLRVLCRQLKLAHNQEPADDASVHRALLTGLLGNIACFDQDRDYLGARNRRLHIFPGSALAKKKPKWIMAAELVETTRLFARCTAKIEPEWLFGINDSLLKRHYSEPHWQPRTGRVMAYERATLYGLTIRDRQRVHYGPIDPRQSREVLIRQALVEGGFRGKLAFLEHNRALLKQVEALEDKARRRDIRVSDEALYAFYDQRIPEGITTARQLERWLQRETCEQPRLLHLSSDDLMLHAAEGVTEAQFPDTLSWQGLELPLRYHFEPGHPADGVTVEVPLALLNRTPRYLLEWLVPGLLAEKCVALVKALPKQWRKQLVPVPEHVARALSRMQRDDQPLIPALSEALKAVSGVSVPAELWSIDQLDNYYRMNVRVVGDEGQALSEGRDLAELLTRHAAQMENSLREESRQSFEVQTATRWEFGELQSEYQFKQGGATVRAYPALVDRQQEVSFELLDSAEAAEANSRAGVVRLLLLKMPQQTKLLRKQLYSGNSLQLAFAATGEQRRDWVEATLEAAAMQVFLGGSELPRSEQAFERMWQSGRDQFVARAESCAAQLADVLSRMAAIRKALKGFSELSWIHSVGDIRQQLAFLMFPGFITTLPWSQLEQYPRYLEAVAQRLEKLRGNLARDKQLTQQLQSLQQGLVEQLGNDPAAQATAGASLMNYRWMLEEFRVSLFAQSLGTQTPVSEKRLKALWKQVLAETPPAA